MQELRAEPQEGSMPLRMRYQHDGLRHLPLDLDHLIRVAFRDIATLQEPMC